jgi:hypothetical protein
VIVPLDGVTISRHFHLVYRPQAVHTHQPAQRFLEFVHPPRM